jgi:hypothetical protein
MGTLGWEQRERQRDDDAARRAAFRTMRDIADDDG